NCREDAEAISRAKVRPRLVRGNGVTTILTTIDANLAPTFLQSVARAMTTATLSGDGRQITCRKRRVRCQAIVPRILLLTNQDSYHNYDEGLTPERNGQARAASCPTSCPSKLLGSPDPATFI